MKTRFNIKQQYIKRMHNGMSSSDSYVIMYKEFAKDNDYDSANEIFEEVMQEDLKLRRKSNILDTARTGRI